ncbi:MAG: DNA polymerase III subunit delta' [Deltaproteobacteria bacterium]|nr:DNA polymerase III subunit delta' [Deltaproteobacteria bacterium]MBI4795145.1 DNA polymerase III subunit delta' [Deltaproteobacteria bacterium]
MATPKKDQVSPSLPPPQPAPMFFREILGQDRVLGHLRAAWKADRLAHAYLFLGAEGVGRASVARALAAALNCARPVDGWDACGDCPSCRRMAAGTHADFLVIGPTSEGRQPQIKIEQIREFRRLTAYPPMEGGWRVALIKPAEAMNPAAANALLKTLEEPPARHLLILAAGSDADLFPTIVSRCQKMAFTPLPSALVVQELQSRRGLSREDAVFLTALSGGSLGRALTLNPEEMAKQRRQVLEDLEKLARGSATAVLDWAKRLAKNNQELDFFILLAQMWYRDLLLLNSGAPSRLLAHQDCLPDLEKENKQGGPQTWFAGFAALAAAHRQLQANLNPQLTLDILGFRLQRQGLRYESR